jgi:hypothetical protein
MGNPIEIPFLVKCKAAATEAAHPFPGAAAAEAWNETGGIHFPPGSNNILGIKAFKGYAGATVFANGTEEVAGVFTPPAVMRWRAYPSFAECFADQLRVLRSERRHPGGPLLYQAALDAKTPEEYIAAECPIWSTSTSKAQDVLLTYRAHLDVLGAQ